MNELMAIVTGLGLAAACGFRVFVPLFCVSLAVNTGIDVPVIPDETVQALIGSDYQWLGRDLVTYALGAGTAVEVAGFYIPWVDNVLDTIATPAAIGAGAMMSGIFMPEFAADSSMNWLLPLIAGGGSAGLVQGASVITRGASSVTTGGLGNPLVATGELVSALVTTVLAILAPLIALFLLILIFFFAIRTLTKFRKRGDEESDSEPADPL